MKRTLKVYAWNVSLMELSPEFCEEVMWGYDKDSSLTTAVTVGSLDEFTEGRLIPLLVGSIAGAQAYTPFVVTSKSGFGFALWCIEAGISRRHYSPPGFTLPDDKINFFNWVTVAASLGNDASTVEYLTKMDTKKATGQEKSDKKVAHLEPEIRGTSLRDSKWSIPGFDSHSPQSTHSPQPVLSPQSSVVHSPWRDRECGSTLLNAHEEKASRTYYICGRRGFRALPVPINDQ
ncbi:hypothetical protein Egran_00040 [Elaphomyces granulatus]|uniref:Uncharacterized protein n=1 Tax=Elaphomyces granulatus TaxID=519963 RepID=A0A232M721_9EURO|nr:hypothetical protein Egran_00040 [Elaphomyces granulatus]